MKAEQLVWKKDSGWDTSSSALNSDAQLVLVFGGIDLIHDPKRVKEIRSFYPSARIVLGSTAGEIAGTRVLDQSIIVTACAFAHTVFEIAAIRVEEFSDSYHCGEALRKKLLRDDLTHVLIISDGILVNGDELVRGMNDGLPSNVLVTGGLAADDGRFLKTYVGLDGVPTSGNIVAIGFYGDRLRVSHGSKGGWDEFGPVRIITKSKGNVLYELDGMNALSLYKKYLGDRANELPGSALLFPLCVFSDDGDSRLVRTILSIDEESGSMTFAGDLPTGARVQFMMANFDRLIDGATTAAEESGKRLKGSKPDLVLMISCVGRKLVLDQRVEEEVESVTEVFGDKPIYAGFYSNGEISPSMDSVACSLHNQTMTITTYTEV